jgi:putative NADH-flavin reductase
LTRLRGIFKDAEKAIKRGSLKTGGVTVKVALIGATGSIGSKILSEALNRGHQVTAIARNVEALKSQPNLTVKQGDAADSGALAKVLAGHDAVIAAVNPGRGATPSDVYAYHLRGYRNVLDAVKKSGVKRFLMVGGAASLKLPTGEELLESPTFPKVLEPFKPGIRAMRDFYVNVLKQERDLDWVFQAPSAMIQPGVRTGKFRLGRDDMLFDKDGQSRISIEDFAMAMIDELEHPKHHRERFTVGY